MFIFWLSIYIPYIWTKPQEHSKLSFVGTDHSEPFFYIDLYDYSTWTEKYVYSDDAWKEMMLFMKHLWVPNFSS